jgi:hypothetical protein
MFERTADNAWMHPISRLLILILLSVGESPAAGQTLPAPDDSRHSMLRQAMLGVLPAEAAVSAGAAGRRCLSLPVDAPADRLESPHGDSLIDIRCSVAAYRPMEGRSGQWFVARYRWTSIFSAEDRSRGPDARDTVPEEEVVVLTATDAGHVRPVWHARFDTGSNAIWRSVTPELGATTSPTRLLSVMSCLNGTGGCSQEFIQQYRDGHWSPVWQVWLDQLPEGHAGRIRHGARIDPRTLRGKAGLYGERDPNCCPSKELSLQLVLHGDSLALQSHTVAPAPKQ